MNELPFWLYILISTGLLGIVITWIIDFIKEWRYNNQLKEILIEEILENLTVVNENIWWDKESGKKWREFLPRASDSKVFNALFSANKMVIFNKDQRRALLYLYRGINNINLSNPFDYGSVIGRQNQKFLQGTLKATKYHIKQILELLDKKQLYEDLELKGIDHTLPSEKYKGKTLEIYPD